MADRSSPLGAYLAVGLIIALGAALMFLLLSAPRTVRIEQSAFGFHGLAGWLAARNIPADVHVQGAMTDLEAFGLRVLPLFDDHPSRRAGFPANREARYLNASAREIEARVIMRKVESLPTLVVLAKWRDGLRLGGFIHPDFLLPSGQPETDTPDAAEAADGVAPAEAGAAGEPPVFGEFDARDMIAGADADIAQFQRLAHDGAAGFETVEFGRYGTVELYAPQYAMAPPGCEALIGTRQRGLLFACEAYGSRYHVLSDPDVLNNHGLMRGRNAEVAVSLIRELANGGAVLVDYSVVPFLVPESARGRELSDLLRYVEPPFLWLWVAATAVLVILLWRGGIRGVPLLRRYTEGHGAARRTAFSVQAGLMRRARADGALLKALLATQMAMLADRVLGRDGVTAGRRERLLRAIRHRDADTAAALEAAISDIESLSDAAAGEVTIAALDRLETAYRKALELT